MKRLFQLGALCIFLTAINEIVVLRIQASCTLKQTVIKTTGGILEEGDYTVDDFLYPGPCMWTYVRMFSSVGLEAVLMGDMATPAEMINFGYSVLRVTVNFLVPYTVTYYVT